MYQVCVPSDKHADFQTLCGFPAKYEWCLVAHIFVCMNYIFSHELHKAF